MFHVIAFAKCPSNELSVIWLYLFIKPVCAACFKAKREENTKKILYRQSKLTVYRMKNINIAVWVYMNLFLKGNDLREVSTAFFPHLITALPAVRE